jgi:hypothetical protein
MDEFHHLDWMSSRAMGSVTRRMDRHAGRIAVLILTSPALFLVDHIHFQYNGFLLGVLLVFVSLIIEARRVSDGVLTLLTVVWRV